jgi:filamentous hemagglutinin
MRARRGAPCLSPVPLKQVMSGPAAGTEIRISMKDPLWPASDGWVKMTQNVNGVRIHYVLNTLTGAVDDFTFVP